MPKISRHRGITPGRHHFGTPGDIISECLGEFVGIRTQRGPGPTLSLSHDHIDGRIELSLDVGGSALLGAGQTGAVAWPAAATASRSSDPARRGRQLRRREGSRGSDPRLLGLTMGGYLIAHSGSDPVDQRSSAPRVRPMRNLRHLHQSRQNSLNRFGAKAV
jgi:hypothetical protein